MDLELYDCRHCNTFGVLPTSDGKCPHCQSDLTAEDRQGSHPPGWASRPATCIEKEERQHRTPNRLIAQCAIVLGILAALGSPVAYAGILVAYGTRNGTEWVASSAVADSMIRAAGLLLLAGWLLIEGGLWALKPRRIVCMVIRIPLYLFGVPMALCLAWMNSLNHLSFP